MGLLVSVATRVGLQFPGAPERPLRHLHRQLRLLLRGLHPLPTTLEPGESTEVGGTNKKLPRRIWFSKAFGSRSQLPSLPHLSVGTAIKDDTHCAELHLQAKGWY